MGVGYRGAAGCIFFFYAVLCIKINIPNGGSRACAGPREYSQLRPPHFRLGSILQLLGGSKCKIRPWVESSGFEGGRKSSEIAFRMAIEMKTCLAMVISGDRQHSASRREDAGEQAAKVSWVGVQKHCRKAIRQQRFTATSRDSQTVKLAKAI